jgi:hypothetical protein
MPNPPYSLDLASSDFYLFPIMKEELERIQVADEDQSFEFQQEILSGINEEELNDIFQAWVRRVQEVSQDKGDYVR